MTTWGSVLKAWLDKDKEQIIISKKSSNIVTENRKCEPKHHCQKKKKRKR